MEIRPADVGELLAVMTVLDGGLLATTAPAVRSAIDAGHVLVAVEGGRVLGAVVVRSPTATTETRITAIAVRRRRRGHGIGSALVRAAAARFGALVAEFDGAVRPFWRSLGFDIEPASAPDRYVGTLASTVEGP